MAKIIFTGDPDGEQSVGSVLNNGKMRIYLVRRDKPRDYIFVGGHRIDDAPTYNITDGAINPEYRVVNGLNTVVESQITFDQTKSVDVTLLLPNKLISVTDRVYAQQRNCVYDAMLIPEVCEAGCGTYFWYGQRAVLGTKQITNAPIGFDDTLAPINTSRTMNITGTLKTYAGKEASLLPASPADAAIHALAVLDDSNSACAGCGCPYQVVYRGGAAFLQYSLDGGATFSSITISAITTDVPAAIITSLDYKNGRLIIGYADVVDATATDGGVAYSNNNGAAVLSTMGTASTGIQAIIRAFNKVYAFGTAGQVFVSCDNGITFTLVAQAETTEDLLAAAYDKTNGLIHIVATGGHYITYNGTSFYNATADLGAGAVDLMSVAVSGSGTVWIGAADGKLYVNDQYVEGDADWVVADDVTNAVGAVVTDPEGYEVYYGQTAAIHRIAGFNFGDPIQFYTGITGNVTAAFAPQSITDEYSTQVFHFVTDAGEHVKVEECNLCIDTGC